MLGNLRKDDFIGNCHYRVLWLNEYLQKKKKFTIDSLYNNLLKKNNKIFNNIDVIQVHPIIYKNKNLLKDFEEVHKCDALEVSIQFFLGSIPIE